MSKQSRHFAIKQLITQRVISNQDDLRKLLLDEGYEVTQATLSRDLKDLGVGRMPTADGARYVLGAGGEERRLTPFIAYEVESIEANEVQIVIKTLPGRAQGVAEILDGFRHPDILGTLAGDNTIFIAPMSTTAIPKIMNDLRAFISGGK